MISLLGVAVFSLALGYFSGSQTVQPEPRIKQCALACSMTDSKLSEFNEMTGKCSCFNREGK